MLVNIVFATECLVPNSCIGYIEAVGTDNNVYVFYRNTNGTFNVIDYNSNWTVSEIGIYGLYIAPGPDGNSAIALGKDGNLYMCYRYNKQWSCYLIKQNVKAPIDYVVINGYEYVFYTVAYSSDVHNREKEEFRYKVRPTGAASWTDHSLGNKFYGGRSLYALSHNGIIYVVGMYESPPYTSHLTIYNLVTNEETEVYTDRIKYFVPAIATNEGIHMFFCVDQDMNNRTQLYHLLVDYGMNTVRYEVISQDIGVGVMPAVVRKGQEFYISHFTTSEYRFGQQYLLTYGYDSYWNTSVLYNQNMPDWGYLYSDCVVFNNSVWFFVTDTTQCLVLIK
jgi:hypothetical protein